MGNWGAPSGSLQAVLWVLRGCGASSILVWAVIAECLCLGVFLSQQGSGCWSCSAVLLPPREPQLHP